MPPEEPTQPRNCAPLETPLVVLTKGYCFKKLLKSGGFAKILVAFSSKIGKEVAVKQFDLDQLGDHYVKHCLPNELKISCAVRHEHVLRAIEMVQTEREAFLVMPLCSKGSINDVLYLGRTTPLEEKNTKRFFGDILSGVNYLHSNRIAHRDLKLDNFLLNEHWRVLLCDFGFSIISPGNSKTRLGQRDAISCSLEPLYLVSICGTPDYMAPELNAIAIEMRRYELEKVPPSERTKYRYDGKAVDMYALGVCLFEMINRAKPFASPTPTGPEEDPNQAREILFKQQINEDYRFSKQIQLSSQCFETIKLCMSPKPEDRPSAHLLLCSNWMAPASGATAIKSKMILSKIKSNRPSSAPNSNLRSASKPMSNAGGPNSSFAQMSSTKLGKAMSKTPGQVRKSTRPKSKAKK